MHVSCAQTYTESKRGTERERASALSHTHFLNFKNKIKIKTKNEIKHKTESSLGTVRFGLPRSADICVLDGRLRWFSALCVVALEEVLVSGREQKCLMVGS